MTWPSLDVRISICFKSRAVSVGDIAGNAQRGEGCDAAGQEWNIRPGFAQLASRVGFVRGVFRVLVLLHGFLQDGHDQRVQRVLLLTSAAGQHFVERWRHSDLEVNDGFWHRKARKGYL